MQQRLRELISKQRAYAPFWGRGRELNVVQKLLESMAIAGCSAYFDPRRASDDPPDVLASDAERRRVAIEVTELVYEHAVRRNAQADQNAIRRWEPGAAVSAVWSKQDLVASIKRRLMDKDNKTLVGGPFARYVVVLHTDEPLLVLEHCQQWLDGQTFGPYRQVDEAYLLFSYHPSLGYPYVSLSVSDAEPGAAPGDRRRDDDDRSE